MLYKKATYTNGQQLISVNGIPKQPVVQSQSQPQYQEPVLATQNETVLPSITTPVIIAEKEEPAKLKTSRLPDWSKYDSNVFNDDTPSFNDELRKYTVAGATGAIAGGVIGNVTSDKAYKKSIENEILNSMEKPETLRKYLTDEEIAKMKPTEAINTAADKIRTKYGKRATLLGLGVGTGLGLGAYQLYRNTQEGF